MIRAFSYLRVSTDRQTDGDGYPRQAAAVLGFASANGYTIAREFKEALTGTSDAVDRPVLNEMISLMQDTGIDTVIIERSDRLSRDLIVGELIIRDFKAAGFKIFSADSGEELVNAGGDPTRVLIRQILGSLAQWERSVINKKLRAARDRKRMETGRCGGQLPVGYYEEEKPLIQLILKLRRAGMVYRAIAEELELRGWGTYRNGVKWTPGTIKNVCKRAGITHDESTPKVIRDIQARLARIESAGCGESDSAKRLKKRLKWYQDRVLTPTPVTSDSFESKFIPV